MYPLKFKPIFKTIVWGGEKIAPYKGIETTGLTAASDEGCSTAGDVIEKYGLDIDSENFIADRKDDKNYTIELLFYRHVYMEDSEDTTTSEGIPGAAVNKDVTRKITPAGEELSEEGCYCKMRFVIRNGFVHGIDMYQLG